MRASGGTGRIKPGRAGALVGLLACGAGWSLGGCERQLQEQGYHRELAPTLDRLVATYEDLASKRFQVLADFESPVQATLFRLEPGVGPARVGISTERARSETGVGALRMSLVNSSQRLVAAGAPEGKWALHRDWSRYHMLLFSVFSPRKLGGFTLSARSGTDAPLVYQHPRILLTAGWNLIRIDLGEMAGRIDLGDVRELQFWCDPLDTPTDLYLDDVILVDNSREVFGSAEREPGDLYVLARGRRLVVGAVDRFELVFSRGQIRQWFDLACDPGRLHDLTGAGSVGPTAVVIPDEVKATVLVDDATQWAGLGIVAEAYQSLVEATPLRVVVQGEWRFGSPDSPPTDTSPYHRWVYSIYRGGRVYVECTGTAREANFQPASVGMVFCCDGDLGFERTLVEGGPDATAGEGGRASYVLFSRAEPGRADLLVVPRASLSARVLENPEDPRLCMAWEVSVEGDHFLFAAAMRVLPTDIDSASQAGPFALDYCRPLPIAMDAGSLVRTDAGDLDNDGFNESRGHYVVQLDGNVAKIRIDGRRQLRFSPVFKLVDVAEREVWVYVDGRQIRETFRDEDGNVLFEVPGVVSREALVEVTSRGAEGGGE